MWVVRWVRVFVEKRKLILVFDGEGLKVFEIKAGVP